MDKHPRQHTITHLVRDAPAMINPGFRNARRALSHVLTQPYVVSKEAFFVRLFEEVERRRHELAADGTLAVFEPGCGAGDFLGRFIDFAARTPGLARVEFVGADLSPEMVCLGFERLNLARRMAALRCDASVVVGSGVNAVNPNDPFYRDQTMPGQFSMIVASQFAHYFPNSATSELAQRHRERGVPFATKDEFYRLCHHLLKPGGLLFVIDDYRGGSESDDEVRNRAWDGHVARQFAEPSVIETIASVDARLAREIARRYVPLRGTEEAAAAARRIRERRRTRCLEEIDSLAAAMSGLTGTFGPGAVDWMAHPSGGTHPNFFMVWARKR